MAKVIKVQPIFGTLGKQMEVPELSSTGDVVLIDNPDGVMGMDGKLLKQPQMKLGDSVNIIATLIRLFPRNRLSMVTIETALKVQERIKTITDGCITLEDTEYEWLMNCLKDDGIGVQLFGFDIVNVIKALRVNEDK